jgi:hypothetical protein
VNRRLLACLVVLTIALGAASRLLPIGNAIWDKSVGDAAYAIMIFFMVAFARPRERSTVIGVVAVALCIAIESFQLTGIPARLPRVLQILLGTRFAWHDVACYVVGGLLATLLHALLSRGPRPEA